MKAIEFLTELFDPQRIFTVEWDDQFGPKEMHATAYDRQGRELNIDFVPIGDEIVEVEFTRGGSHSITGRGDAIAVLNTVVNVIKKYLTNSYAAPYLIFSAKEASRAKLYQTMIQKLSSTMGYRQVTDFNTLPPDIADHLAYTGSSTSYVLTNQPPHAANPSNVTQNQ